MHCSQQQPQCPSSFVQGNTLSYRQFTVLLPWNAAFRRGSVYFLCFPKCTLVLHCARSSLLPLNLPRRLRRATPGAGSSSRRQRPAAPASRGPPARPSLPGEHVPPRRGARGASPAAPQLRAAKMAPVEGEAVPGSRPVSHCGAGRLDTTWHAPGGGQRSAGPGPQVAAAPLRSPSSADSVPRGNRQLGGRRGSGRLRAPLRLPSCAERELSAACPPSLHRRWAHGGSSCPAPFPTAPVASSTVR